MNRSARLTAYLVLKKVFYDDAFLNIALKKINTNHLDSQSMAFVTALTNSVLEHLNQIDYAYAPLVHGKRVHNAIRLVLRTAVCEMLFMNTPDRAAINEAVNLTERIGKKPLKGFVNAVLRKFSLTKDSIEYPDIEQDLKAYLSVFSGYPDWLIDEMIDSYGETFAKGFLLYKETDTNKTAVRLNTLKREPEGTIKAVKSEGLAVEKHAVISNAATITNFTDIENRRCFKNGEIAVLGSASMLSVLLSGVKKEMRVLDACAAPGGKTAYLAALMENTGHIDAWDIYPHRVEITAKNLTRLGVTNTDVFVQDAVEYNAQYQDKYDLVLLDMPCASLGLAYKKADIKRLKSKADIKALADIQRSILNTARHYVKPDGTLMVVTCSITNMESDIDWFFKENKDFSEDELDIPKGIEYVKKPHGIQLFPHLSGMDGFFICKIKRT